MKRRIIFALLALLRGKALSTYRLTFYHSVRFKANAQQKTTMDHLVTQDKAQATGTELRRKGHTSSLILCLPPQGRTHRYLCYLTNRSKDHWSITLVYMEGSVSSIDDQLHDVLMTDNNE